ncbi:MAG: sulfite exporter TauE/SafE family protein [Kangiellaceae bacterium]|nr:sulfite exporter TauE/SafE family protein [Kangiellaceae bacterium]
MLSAELVSAFLLGLLGAGHCLGMCGGIIGTLSVATDSGSKKWLRIVSYQYGRIASYTFFGLVAGWIGFQLSGTSDIPWLTVVSAILMILMGLYISRLWTALTYLEKAGNIVWRQISPISKKILPVKNTGQAFLLGALWGWLPCGLVYTALGYAISKSSPLTSALFMLCFGLGTLPATLSAGAAGGVLKEWLNNPWVRNLSALLFIFYGFYLLWPLFFPGEMSHHHHH